VLVERMRPGCKRRSSCLHGFGPGHTGGGGAPWDSGDAEPAGSRNANRAAPALVLPGPRRRIEAATTRAVIRFSEDCVALRCSEARPRGPVLAVAATYSPRRAGLLLPCVRSPGGAAPSGSSRRVLIRLEHPAIEDRSRSGAPALAWLLPMSATRPEGPGRKGEPFRGLHRELGAAIPAVAGGNPPEVGALWRRLPDQRRPKRTPPCLGPPAPVGGAERCCAANGCRCGGGCRAEPMPGGVPFGWDAGDSEFGQSPAEGFLPERECPRFCQVGRRWKAGHGLYKTAFENPGSGGGSPRRPRGRPSRTDLRASPGP